MARLRRKNGTYQKLLHSLTEQEATQIVERAKPQLFQPRPTMNITFVTGQTKLLPEGAKNARRYLISPHH
jgi:hypothetical protein